MDLLQFWIEVCHLNVTTVIVCPICEESFHVIILLKILSDMLSHVLKMESVLSHVIEMKLRPYSYVIST